MTTRDHEGRSRRAIYLPDELWDWCEQIAARDGVNRSDFIEGLILLAQDEVVES